MFEAMPTSLGVTMGRIAIGHCGCWKVTQKPLGRHMIFWFRNRKKYNGAVDVKLNNEYQIETRDNPHFPGILKYLEFIDVSWNENATEDECALRIATLYLSGLIRHGLWDEGRVVASRFEHVGPYGVERGLIRLEIWEKCVALIQKTQREVAERKQ